MLKFIGNIIRIIFFVYLVFIIIIFALYFANRKYYGGNYTNVAGYTFFIPDNDYLEPDISKGDFVVIRLANPDIYYKEGDYVLIEFGETARVEKIIKATDKDKFVVNFTNIPDLPEVEENTTQPQFKEKKDPTEEEPVYVYTKKDFEDKTFSLQGLEGKVILYGDKVNEWYSVLTSWWLLGIMVLYLFLFPTLFYKRYE